MTALDFDALNGRGGHLHVFYCFSALAGPPQGNRAADGKRSDGIFVFGRCVAYLYEVVLGRGGIIALRREGGRKGVAVCIYVSYLYLVFCRDVGIGDYLLFHCGYDARVMCGGMRLVVV